MRPYTIDLLIAEDNPSDAELIRESLGPAYAHRLQVAADGAEVLDVLLSRGDSAGRDGEHLPRLVLLDIKLPKVDGLEVLRQLRQDARTRALVVVMLTSSRIEDDVRRAYDLGANSYVQKPVEFERFRTTVRAIGDYWLGINEPPPAVSRGEARS